MAALARHPEFSLEGELAAPRVPPEENLARCPLLAPLDDGLPPRRTGRERAVRPSERIHSLRNPFGFLFNADPTDWRAPRIRGNDWARGEFVRLEEVERSGLARVIGMRKAGTPARTILATLTNQAPIISELQKEAVLRPRTQFKQCPSQLVEIIQLLSVRAVARLRVGEEDANDVLLMLRLAEGGLDLPVSQAPMLPLLIRPGFQPIFEGLAQRRWNDGQLSRIQKELAKFELWEHHQSSVRDLTRQNVSMVDGIYASWAEADSWLRTLRTVYPEGWVNELKAQILTIGLEEYLPVSDAKEKRISLARAAAARSQRSPQTLIKARDLREHFWHLTRNFAHLQTSLYQAQTACAIERYRLQHGRFPAKLEELAPRYIHCVPHDILTGQPLIYRQDASGERYTLYSVGWDGLDDGGRVPQASWDAAPVERRGIDWVWNPLP